MADRWRVLWFLVFGLLAGCWSGAIPTNQRPIDQAWADSAVVVLREGLEERWGHSFRSVPKVQVVSMDSAAMVLDSFPIVVRRDDAVRGAWAAVGLYRAAAEERIAAGRLRQVATRSLYVPATRRILLVPRGTRQEMLEALGHELVHALQDEVSPIETRFAGTREEDALVGLLGALEGQAVYLSHQMVETAPSSGEACSDPSSALWHLSRAIDAQPDFRGIPPALVLPSYAPYVFGAATACAMARRYGASGLDSLLVRPPNGSWQLWHPWSYLHGHRVEDWDSSWAGVALPAGARPVGQTRLGEVRLAALLLEWDRQGSGSLLRGLGLQWRGDRLWVATWGPEADTGLAWNLAFDQAASARRFARAWWRVRERRAGVPLPLAPRYARGLSLRWKDPRRRAVMLVQEGRFVRVVDGFDEAGGERVMEALRRLPLVGP